MFDLPKYGNGPCLARMAALLDALGVDRTRLQRRAVVVTGSNGKGSTAAFCAGIARAYGLRTGLFTSPHLFRVNERFQVDGVAVDDNELARLSSQVAAAIGDLARRHGESFGAFEAMFALACLHFQERGCDFVAFEAGIGGRYDPVRLVGARVACVASVDFEHVDLLGPSLELIASDKSDACAAGGTIVYGENCRGLRPHLVEYNRYRRIKSLFVRDQIALRGETATASGQQFDLEFGPCRFQSLQMNLLGSFQCNNAAIAVSLFLLWLRGKRAEMNPGRVEAAVRSGLREVRWPGRLELIGQDPLTIMDVGHTPDAIRQSLSSLKAIYGAEGWVLVLGVSFDKKAGAIVGALAPGFDMIVCTAAHHKGAKAETIADTVRQANPHAALHVAATIEEAVGLSQSLAASLRRKVYVAGGLFLAIEYATAMRGGRPQELNFF